ncbi:hypothetical protein JL722_9451 [Aureococcus anophagefferens]|nr:hypothetical protein JL722_9451 [Aureococcus anophagefferens]
MSCPACDKGQNRKCICAASCLADYTATLEAYVGDDVELDDDERDARSAAREALGGVQCEVEAVRNESAETDGFAAAAVPAAPAPAAAAAPTVADGSEPSTTSEDCSGFLLAGP